MFNFSKINLFCKFINKETNDVYQTLHFLTGFMGDPTGHPQSSPKLGMLENGPLILNLAGE